MKWFKHISTSLDDPDIFEAVDRFGGDGYLVFFGTLEIMAREFDVNLPGSCTIPVRFLTKKLQLSRQKTFKILSFFQEKERILYAESNGSITLRCPKLKEMCDNWTQKQLRSNSEVTPPQEEEVEEEEDKDTSLERSNTVTPCPIKEIVKAYHDTLPELPIVRSVKGFEKNLRARWREDPERQSLDWWYGFFSMDIAKSDFLMGRSKDFQCNLGWIVGPKNFSKIMNGQYVNRTGSNQNKNACREFINE